MFSNSKSVVPSQRFRHMGATVTTSEAILLQLVGDKDHPKFKDIQGLIKTLAPDSGLLNKLWSATLAFTENHQWWKSSSASNVLLILRAGRGDYLSRKISRVFCQMFCSRKSVGIAKTKFAVWHLLTFYKEKVNFYKVECFWKKQKHINKE